MESHMKLLVVTALAFASAAQSPADIHVVSAYDMTFEPEVIHVDVGDIILWEYISGSPHTVTSGEDCSWDGYLHAPLSIVDPIFEWVVPADAPAVLPYFCAPHCINGMVGTIHVNQPCLADITGDNNVDISDLLLVLEQWGATDSPADANMDGIVNVGDLLLIISGWGPCD